ncbi:NAD-dependent epimerase/dehydratase family protein [Sinorhizobium meliloti]|nr:NAD-dependent epimerase/dehydratase family protein [Sinorhizobium meliloti]
MTGGTGGIGRAIAQCFRDAGATVHATRRKRTSNAPRHEATTHTAGFATAYWMSGQRCHQGLHWGTRRPRCRRQLRRHHPPGSGA